LGNDASGGAGPTAVALMVVVGPGKDLSHRQRRLAARVAAAAAPRQQTPQRIAAGQTTVAVDQGLGDTPPGNVRDAGDWTAP
jgi:hypothetical protein